VCCFIAGSDVDAAWDDINVLSDFARGEPAVVARLRREAPSQLAVSVVTEMEVECGLARNPNLAPRVREAMRMLLNTISLLAFERLCLAAGTQDRNPQCARIRSRRRARARGLAQPVNSGPLQTASAQSERQWYEQSACR
jgi:predicted nucleic acid-binding protein